MQTPLSLALLLPFVVLCVPPARAETLTGRVLEDHSGVPLALAGVRVIETAKHAVVAELETDGQGRFRAPELPPGEYRLEISRPNFVDTSIRVELKGVELNAAPRNLMARLVRRVAFSGQVTDQQGKPLVGVTVFALPKPETGNPASPYGGFSRDPHNASTDAQGRYRIYGLPPGRYLVAASYGASTMAVGQSGDAVVSPGIGSGALFYPGNAQPQVFSLTGGEDIRNIDFTAGQAVLFSVAGKVDLPSGTFRVWLALTPVAQPALAASVAQTRPDGSFRFEGIPPGQYNLFAAGPSQGRNGAGTSLGPKPQFARSTVSVGGQNVEGLSVALGAGRSGTVAVAGTCAASVKITLASLEDWAAILERTVDIAPGHELTLANLAPTRYQVRVSDAGSGCYQTETPVLDLTGPAETAKVTVAAAGSIRGVLTGDAAKDPDTVVSIMAADGSGELQMTSPDSQARFEFRDLRPGPYKIVFRSGTKPPRVVSVEVRGGTPTELPL